MAKIDQKFWQPLPIWKGDQLEAVSFGMQPAKGGISFEVGLIFKQANYGERVFKAISNWNDRKTEDPNNNIGVSFITEDDDTYLSYLYPNPVSLFKDQVSEGEIFLADICIICKEWDNSPSSAFRRFQQHYDGGQYLLTAHSFVNGAPQTLPGITPIMKSSLKIKRAAELTPDELEYQHRKMVMGR